MNKTGVLLLIGFLFTLFGCNSQGSIAASDSQEDRIYQAFQTSASSTGIDLSQYAGYTKGYVNSKVQRFCSLLQDGNIVQLQTELSFGEAPGGLLSKPDVGGRIQKIIYNSGVPIACPRLYRQ